MKRFWTAVTVAEAAPGWEVRLDARPIRTPGRKPLIVPTRALADALAAEWAAVGETVTPLAMPVTRAANTAIERVVPHRAEVAGMVAAFGETDLLCYRAPGPEGLRAEQSAAWDPLLAWTAETHGARLVMAEGVMFVAQPPRALDALRAAVERFGPWELTALHELVTLSGSLVLGLAVAEGRVGAEEGWELSRLDEAWNIREWGEDAEAARMAAAKRADFLAAHRLLGLLREG